MNSIQYGIQKVNPIYVGTYYHLLYSIFLKLILSGNFLGNSKGLPKQRFVISAIKELISGNILFGSVAKF